NPVAGVTISWAVISGAGSANPATSTSNASGIASTTWTLGTRRTSTDSVQLAQATGVGSPLAFTAFAVPGPVNASQTSVVASPAALTASNGTRASRVTVTARDQYGNPVRGKTVTLAATGTANAVVQPRDTTDPNGVATGSLSSTFAEAKVVSAIAAGVPITQRDTVTVSPAAATNLSFLVGPNNVAAGAAITPAIQVEVRDQFNNRVTAASPGIMLGFGTAHAGDERPVQCERRGRNEAGAHDAALEHRAERPAVGAATGGAAAGRQRQPGEPEQRRRDGDAEPGGGDGEQ